MEIEFKNVSFEYSQLGVGSKKVLKDINFTIRKSEFIALIGPSGAGKTTLLQHFTGLLKPSGGEIYVDGRNIWDKKYRLSELRKRVGLVFQFPEKQLFEETVFDDVAFGPKNLQLSDSEIEKRVQEAIELVGLNYEDYKNRAPHHLSGGEKRRVAIAGVLAMAPEMLILDEPTSGLDPAGCRRIIELLKALNEQKVAILLITHYLDLALEAADRIIILNNGKIFFDGERDEAVEYLENNPDIRLKLPNIINLSKKLHAMKVLPHWKFYSIVDLKNALKNKTKKI